MNSCSRTKAIQSASLSSPWIGLWNKLWSINFWARKVFSLCLKVTFAYSSCFGERQTEMVIEKSCATVNWMVQATLKSDMRIKVVFKSKVDISNLFAEITLKGMPSATWHFSILYTLQKVFYGTQFWLYQCLPRLTLHWVGRWLWWWERCKVFQVVQRKQKHGKNWNDS